MTNENSSGKLNRRQLIGTAAAIGVTAPRGRNLEAGGRDPADGSRHDVEAVLAPVLVARREQRSQQAAHAWSCEIGCNSFIIHPTSADANRFIGYNARERYLVRNYFEKLPRARV